MFEEEKDERKEYEVDSVWSLFFSNCTALLAISIYRG